MAATILVVDDDVNVQRLLSYTLKQEGYEVIIAADGVEGHRLWVETSPALVLLDVALPKLDGYQVAGRIRAEEGPGRHVPIIMLTTEANVEQKVRGLRAGADDYLVKPFHPAELLARIKSLLARFASRDVLTAKPVLGRLYAFYGTKGGVGTTTLAVNTAIALHNLGRKVCLVDGNLQLGDHRVFLDLGLDRKSIIDVVQAPSIDADLVSKIVVPHETGVDLLLAPPTPEAAELVTPEHVPVILETLRSLYDYVLVDLDKRLDEINLRVFDSAEAIFFIMNADLSCLKNVRLVLETMSRLGYGQRKAELVLNRSTAYTGINLKSAEGALRRSIEHEIVNDYRVAITALNGGLPAIVSKPDSPFGKGIVEFARTIDKRPSTAGLETSVVPG
jgi:pilus assembly protein CpaE